MLISFESSTIKMKFGQHLRIVSQTFLKCFWVNAGEWQLVPSPLIILGYVLFDCMKFGFFD